LTAEIKTSRPHPDYGIDAPQVVLRFLVLGAITVSLAMAARAFLSPRLPFLPIGLSIGGTFLLTAAVMLWGSKIGKVSFRERLLEDLALQGNEFVLDVGCGRGLMLIGAAKRLTTGRAFGVDLWQTQDQSGNSPEITLQNARRARVAERVEIKTADARQLPFEANTFDLVLSSWALHNIYEPGERAKALQEIVRVLKPGGQVVIVDIRHTAEYARLLRENGLAQVHRLGPNFLFLIPSFTLRARKPATQTNGPLAA
jgi:arsenite methyltransferase